MKTSLGIDGCRAGWIVAEAPDVDATPRFWLAATFAEVVARVVEHRLVTCVDVPIGLIAGPRLCDVEARKMLGRVRRSSVFPSPCRAALRGADRQDMRTINRSETGRSLSEQALGIVPKIREVDAAMTPELQQLIREVHPEVAFAAESGKPLAYKKSKEEGRAERLALLPPLFAEAVPTRSSRPWHAKDVALDDYVDALVALVVAIRISGGTVRRLPARSTECDERGLTMEICY